MSKVCRLGRRVTVSSVIGPGASTGRDVGELRWEATPQVICANWDAPARVEALEAGPTLIAPVRSRGPGGMVPHRGATTGGGSAVGKEGRMIPPLLRGLASLDDLAFLTRAQRDQAKGGPDHLHGPGRGRLVYGRAGAGGGKTSGFGDTRLLTCLKSGLGVREAILASSTLTRPTSRSLRSSAGPGPLNETARDAAAPIRSDDGVHKPRS